jgi:hypothetical protein
MGENRGRSKAGSGRSGEVAEDGWQDHEMPRNVEADGESLKSLEVACGTSDKGAGRSRDVEYQRRQGQGRIPTF